MDQTEQMKGEESAELNAAFAPIQMHVICRKTWHGRPPSVATSNSSSVLMTDKVIAERTNDLIFDVLK